MSEDARTSETTPEQELQPSDPRYWEEVLGGRQSAAWLLQDPEIDAAIRRGRPHAVYRLFRRRLSAAPSGAAREALEAVVRNRRFFLEPMQGSPGLSTLNGIGARVYGSQERNPEDGTYITTQFFTLLFLPLWPLAQYLVAKAPGEGWIFFGRVPLSSFHRWWRRAVLAGLATAVVALGLSVWRTKTRCEVHFLNGLPVPVAVTMGDDVIEVGPGARVAQVMRAGRHHVVARGPDGTVLEERDVEVPGKTDLVVYNVLGSAPLVLEVAGYTADGVDPARAAEVSKAQSLAGDSWVVQDDVDYVFRAAPERIKMREGTSVTTRRRVDVYEGDWRTTLQHFAIEKRMAEAASLARTAARLLPGNEEALVLATGYSELAGEVETVRAFLEEALEARPNDLQTHRHYQGVMKSLGRLDDVEGKYRAAYEASPHAAQAGYLYARILGHRKALPIYEALAIEHPDDPWLLRGLAWVYYHTGRFGDALPHHQRLLAMRPDEAGSLVDFVAQELVAAGRVREALEAVGAVLDAAPARHARGLDPLAGSTAWNLVGLHARLRRLAPDPAQVPSAEERWRPFVEDARPSAELLAETAARARDGDALGLQQRESLSPESRTYCELTLLSQSDPELAALRALEADESTLLRLDDEVRLAIACELDRTGERAQAKLLLGGLSASAAAAVGVDDLDALPVVDGLSEDLVPLLRAAMLVAASRRAEDAERREALLEEARRLDVLRIVVPE